MTDLALWRALAKRRIEDTRGLCCIEVAKTRDYASWQTQKGDLRVMDELLSRRHLGSPWGITCYAQSSGRELIRPLVARPVMDWLDVSTPDWGWHLHAGVYIVLTLCLRREVDRIAYTLRFT